MELDKLYHCFYGPCGGLRIPADTFTLEQAMDNVENGDYKGRKYEYTGTFSEYSLLYKQGSEYGGVVLLIEKDNQGVKNKPFKLSKYFKNKIGSFYSMFGNTGYHGSDLNSNRGVTLSKKDLQELIKCMSDKDRLLFIEYDHCTFETKDTLPYKVKNNLIK